MELAFRELGGTGNPPLAILHGMLGSSRNWQTAGCDLAERYHVFALDLRNHGASPHAEEMSYEAMAADVAEFLDARGLARITLLGHSMGGKVAMLLACREPARVERLMIVDIAPREYRWVGHRAEFATMRELDLAHLRSRAEAELRFEARVPDWAMRKFLTTNLKRGSDGHWRWIVNLPTLIAALPVLEKNPLADGERFDGSVLFVTGGRSAYVQPEDHVAIRRHFPAARVETIADSGHNPHMERREEFVRRVFDAFAD